MLKFNQTLNTSHTSCIEDGDLRSPRTPTFVPSPTSLFTVPPFDPSRVFAQLSPANSIEHTPPPPKPLGWVWQCHLCRSRYPLGATRRCLLDGHFYCSGETDRPNLKKKKKGQSCTSEFDYVGWKAMQQWKTKLRRGEKFGISREPEGCENCEFPSHCRYADHSLSGEDYCSSGFAETDLDTPSTATSASRADKLSRFYKKENVTFDSILAGSPVEVSKSKQSKVTDYYKPNRKSRAHEGKFSTSTMLREIMKSAERRAGGQALLSPIQEECLDGDRDMQDSEDTTDHLALILDS